MRVRWRTKPCVRTKTNAPNLKRPQSYLTLALTDVEIESEERWAQVKDTDVCKRWWAWMRDFIVFNDDGTPAARVLPELFFLP